MDSHLLRNSVKRRTFRSDFRVNEITLRVGQCEIAIKIALEFHLGDRQKKPKRKGRR